ncbi:MAG: VOC family protein, partial [Acetobacteraceae bacterium]
LGMEREEFGEDHRTALKFGGQKLNLHPADAPLPPHARRPAPGSGDLCFVTAVRPEDVIAHLHALGVAVELGPVARTGALGAMVSVYCRDPDGNLVEIASYLAE